MAELRFKAEQSSSSLSTPSLGCAALLAHINWRPEKPARDFLLVRFKIQMRLNSSGKSVNLLIARLLFRCIKCYDHSKQTFIRHICYAGPLV